MLVVTVPKFRLLCEVDYHTDHAIFFYLQLLSLFSNTWLQCCLSVIQVLVVIGWPRDLLSSIFLSISCSCDVLCLIRCPRYCSFLVLNCLTISLPVPILLNTSSLLIFSVHDIFNYSVMYPHLKGIESGQQ